MRRMPLEGISKTWLFLKECALAAAAPIYKERFNTDVLFDALMKENMQCWVCFVGPALSCVVFTSFIFDPYSNAKSLFIYSLCNPNWVAMTDEVWAAMIDRAKEFARENGCLTISAVAMNQQVINMSIKNGAKTLTSLEWEV